MESSLGHDDLLSARRAVNTRAIRVMMKVSRTSMSAAPHARSCAAGNAEVALPKICSDRDVFASWNRCGL
jgi:hypothetical protein